MYHAFVHIGLFVFDGEEEGFSLCSSVSNRGVKISYCFSLYTRARLDSFHPAVYPDGPVEQDK